MKLLIITSNPSAGPAIRRMATTLLGFESAVICSHDDEIVRISQDEKPTHVLVCEYEEGVGPQSKFAKAQQTRNVFLIAPHLAQRVVYCGFTPSSIPDFVELPTDAEGFRKAFDL